MNIFRKSIAYLCALLFIMSGILALFAFSLEQQAFYSDAYKRAFEKQNLYERVPQMLADALQATTATGPTAHPFLQALTATDWHRTILLILPPQDLKAITDFALDSLFDFLNNQTDTVIITLTPLKSNLTGPAGMEVARQVLAVQPACTTDQLLQMGMGFLSGDIALCNPPPEMLDLVTPILQTQMQTLIAAIPNEIPLLSPTQLNTAQNLRTRLELIRTLLKITPVFPVLFLFALTAFAVRSLMDWLKWWGWPFVLTGGISLVLALAGSPVLGFIVSRFLAIQGAGFLPPLLLAILQETVSSVTSEILRPVVIAGAVLGLIGLGMVVTSWLLVFRDRARLAQ